MLIAGNHKLSRNVLNFSLPPVRTCRSSGMCEQDCYALKAYNRYPAARRLWDENFEISLTEDFSEMMIDEIRARQGTIVRIHTSGDFYSDRYARKWKRVAKALQEVRFYGYTKVMELVQDAALDKLENVNIINSVLPDGSINFGPEQEMIYKSEQFGIPICHYRRGHGAGDCGSLCTLCLTAPRMLFVKH